MYEFFVRYIPNFDENYLDDNGQLKSFITMAKIDKATYLYVSTKIYVPNKVLGTMLEEENIGDLYIYVFGKKSMRYAKMINDILAKTKEAERSKKILIINEVSRSGSTDISVVSFDPRDLSTLVYSNNELETIVHHIDRYNNSIDFYKSKQLPYKTGILLFGMPGTGKSSIVKSLATKYNRNIVQINVSNISKINFGELTTMINNDITEQYIVLFEDIDTLYLNRESTNPGEDSNNVIQDLLQFLDSSVSPKNVIFVATTNHIERLDSAIIRDGRFDLHVNVKGITVKDIKKFCDIFEVDYEQNINEILRRYGEPIKEGASPDAVKLYNQSKIQNILLQIREPSMSESMKKDLDTMSED
jgi:AAA+ superfamily predicted ATPase